MKKAIGIICALALLLTGCMQPATSSSSASAPAFTTPPVSEPAVPQSAGSARSEPQTDTMSALEEILEKDSYAVGEYMGQGENGSPLSISVNNAEMQFEVSSAETLFPLDQYGILIHIGQSVRVYYGEEGTAVCCFPDSETARAFRLARTGKNPASEELETPQPEGAAALLLTPRNTINGDIDSYTQIPEFLTPDQQDLFRAAARMYSGLGGGGHPGYQVDFTVSVTQTVGESSIKYDLDTAFGYYQTFNVALHAVFTDAFCEELLPGDPGNPVMEYRGGLYAQDADKGGDQSLKKITYELTSQTDNVIKFDMVGQFDRGSNGKLTTVRYPIRMEKGANGWRFASVASPAYEEPRSVSNR